MSRIAKPEPIPKLVKLWTSLTPIVRTRLTKLMRTTPGTMRQYVEGRRLITPELAARLERAVNELELEPINRVELNRTCRECDYARACVERVGRRYKLKEDLT